MDRPDFEALEALAAEVKKLKAERVYYETSYQDVIKQMTVQKDKLIEDWGTERTTLAKRSVILQKHVATLVDLVEKEYIDEWMCEAIHDALNEQYRGGGEVPKDNCGKCKYCKTLELLLEIKGGR